MNFCSCGFEPRQPYQLSPHVLIQGMRTSFCIYRLEIRHNTGYNYQIWAIGAGNELSGVILPDGGFHTLALFSLLMTAFGGSKLEIYHEMHPTLDDNKVSSTM